MYNISLETLGTCITCNYAKLFSILQKRCRCILEVNKTGFSMRSNYLLKLSFWMASLSFFPSSKYFKDFPEVF